MPKTKPPREGLDFRRSDGTAFRSTGHEGWEVDASPGDMTRYRLVVALDPAGGLLVAWPSQPSLWWADSNKGGEVRLLCGGRRGRAEKAYDAAIIGCLLDEWVR